MSVTDLKNIQNISMDHKISKINKEFPINFTEKEVLEKNNFNSFRHIFIKRNKLYNFTSNPDIDSFRKNKQFHVKNPEQKIEKIPQNLFTNSHISKILYYENNKEQIKEGNFDNNLKQNMNTTSFINVKTDFINKFSKRKVNSSLINDSNEFPKNVNSKYNNSKEINLNNELNLKEHQKAPDKDYLESFQDQKNYSNNNKLISSIYSFNSNVHDEVLKKLSGINHEGFIQSYKSLNNSNFSASVLESKTPSLIKLYINKIAKTMAEQSKCLIQQKFNQTKIKEEYSNSKKACFETSENLNKIIKNSKKYINNQRCNSNDQSINIAQHRGKNQISKKENLFNKEKNDESFNNQKLNLLQIKNSVFKTGIHKSLTSNFSSPSTMKNSQGYEIIELDAFKNNLLKKRKNLLRNKDDKSNFHLNANSNKKIISCLNRCEFSKFNSKNNCKAKTSNNNSNKSQTNSINEGEKTRHNLINFFKKNSINYREVTTKYDIHDKLIEEILIAYCKFGIEKIENISIDNFKEIEKIQKCIERIDIFKIGFRVEKLKEYLSPISKKPNLIKDRLNEIFCLDHKVIDFHSFVLFYLFYIKKCPPSFQRNLLLLEKMFALKKEKNIDLFYMKFVINWLIQNHNPIHLLSYFQIKDLSNILSCFESLFKNSENGSINVDDFCKNWQGKEDMLNLLVNLILY